MMSRSLAPGMEQDHEDVAVQEGAWDGWGDMSGKGEGRVILCRLWLAKEEKELR